MALRLRSTRAVFFILSLMSSVALSANAQRPTVGSENSDTRTRNDTRPSEAQKLASCMELWEPATHMTKSLWRAVCKRIETDAARIR